MSVISQPWRCRPHRCDATYAVPQVLHPPPHDSATSRDMTRAQLLKTRDSSLLFKPIPQNPWCYCCRASRISKPEHSSFPEVNIAPPTAQPRTCRIVLCCTTRKSFPYSLTDLCPRPQLPQNFSQMSSTSFFTGTPVCSGCGQKTSYATIQLDSAIGNAGRPYYKCGTPGCEFAFFCYDDHRGISHDNLPCYCGRPSRRRLAGKAPRNSSFLKIQCAIGVCDYSIRELDQRGQPEIVPRAEIAEWIRLGKL